MPIALRADFAAIALRLAAKRSKDGAQARRLLALAAIYDGASRTEAASIGSVTVQIVRDWVMKFNAHGPSGLIDRKPRDVVEHAAPCSATGACVACGGVLRPLGEDVTELLNYVPGSFRVIRHVRPKLSCRSCEAITQAPSPSLPIRRGRAGAGLLAHVLVSRYGDHLPLHRQAEIYAREDIDLSRSTLADMVGKLYSDIEHRSCNPVALQFLFIIETVLPTRSRSSMSMSSLVTYSGRKIVPYTGVAILGLIALTVANGCYFTVPQTDVAFVTRFGKVENPAAGPVGPGLHFKLPIIEGVDRIRTVRDTDDLGVVSALTKDTQAISLKASVTTSVPASAAYHLLYQVGRQGNVDLNKNYNATIITELRNVIGRHEIGQIAGQDREAVLAEIQIAAGKELERLYGVQVDQVQISVDAMPETYAARINQAMLSQAAILQSQRDQTKAQIDADTAKIVAAGLANRAIEEARGRSQSLLLEAKAAAEATEVRGQAEADAQQKMAAALTSNPQLVELRKADKWDGRLPVNNYANIPLPFMTSTK